MALLRATGATPGQMRRLVVGETMLLAAVAITPAWWLGPRVGARLLDAFADAGVVPDTIAFRSGIVPQIVGIAIALFTALGAAFTASGAAAKVRPAEALAEGTDGRGHFSRVRLVAGLLCLVGGGALAWGTAGSDGPDAAGVATPAAMVWTAGFGLLAPPLCAALVRALRRPLRATSGLAGRLADHNITARPGLTAAAVTPVMLATGLAIGLIYMQTTGSAGAKEAFRDTLRADIVLTSDAGGLPPELVDKVAAVTGVEAASARIPSTGYLLREPSGPEHPKDANPGESGPTELPLIGVTAEGAAATTGAHTLSGNLRDLHGDSVALPARHAGGHRLGDLLDVRLGDGSHARLKLVATLEARPGYETMLMPATTLAAHTDAALIPQILVRATPGTDHTALSATLATFAADHPGLRTTGSETLVAAHDDQDDTQAWMAYLVLGVVVGYATIALVNTQILATVRRRREFTLYRLVGAGRRQVLHMAAVEAITTTVAGLTLGTTVAALTLIPLDISVLDSPLPAGSPAIWFTIAGTALTLTLLATLAPTAALLRGNPGDPAAAE
ncbi:FtsX-like permease family protein [Streptomyces sp. SID3343]|nr:ABC transporter permease [Streptomyces sp. SID3343]MYW00464.1 FtsX-like permease family protein [Streptomyces sp. SID3343]